MKCIIYNKNNKQVIKYTRVFSTLVLQPNTSPIPSVKIPKNIVEISKSENQSSRIFCTWLYGQTTPFIDELIAELFIKVLISDFVMLIVTVSGIFIDTKCIFIYFLFSLPCLWNESWIFFFNLDGLVLIQYTVKSVLRGHL